MPYNPEENRTTTHDDLKAPKGKFRVIGVDTFDGGDWIVGDYRDKEEAFKNATVTQQMEIRYVYNDKGQRIYKQGTF